MELAAAGTPFLYFPLRNHFEQNFHVAARLDRYNAGRRMTYADATPERIAEAMLEELNSPRVSRPVASDGARRAAASRLGDEQFSAAQWQDVIEEFGRTCAYCGAEGDLVSRRKPPSFPLSPAPTPRYTRRRRRGRVVEGAPLLRE